MCLFMAPSAGFLALYTPNNVGMISATACTSGGEGLIYIDGGSVTMSNIFAKSNRALSGGFVSAKNLQMFKVNSGVVQNTTVTEDGSAFATYNSNEVNITGVSISTCKSGGSGTIYLEGGRRGYLSELTMNSNNVNQYGVGFSHISLSPCMRFLIPNRTGCHLYQWDGRNYVGQEFILLEYVRWAWDGVWVGVRKD